MKPAKESKLQTVRRIEDEFKKEEFCGFDKAKVAEFLHEGTVRRCQRVADIFSTDDRNDLGS